MFRNLIAILCCITSLALSAQVEVVVRVDMSAETVSAEGPKLIGSFQNWNLNEAIPMEKVSEDFYEASIFVDPGTYEYSFVNGSLETDRECQDELDCQEECFVTNSNGKRVRSVVVTDGVDFRILSVFEYNTCLETLTVTEELRNGRNLVISPNPFSETTNLVFSNPKNQPFDILLYDLSGQLIREFSDLRGQDFKIDRQDLATGMYLVSLRTNKGEVANRKLIVH